MDWLITTNGMVLSTDRSLAVDRGPPNGRQGRLGVVRPQRAARADASQCPERGAYSFWWVFLALTSKSNCTLQLRRKISLRSHNLHRLPGLTAKPMVQLLGCAGYESPLLRNRHSLGFPPLDDGYRFAQEIGNLLPTLQRFRLALGFCVYLGRFRHGSLRCNTLGNRELKEIRHIEDS